MGTTMLDEVDMKELVLAPEIIHQRDADDSHQITLEHNRKIHTIPLVAPEDVPFTKVGQRRKFGFWVLVYDMDVWGLVHGQQRSVSSDGKATDVRKAQ